MGAGQAIYCRWSPKVSTWREVMDQVGLRLSAGELLLGAPSALGFKPRSMRNEVEVWRLRGGSGAARAPLTAVAEKTTF